MSTLPSVFVQIQYRTNVLANVSYSLYLVFEVLTDWGTQTWWLVVGIAALAAAYTAVGGLKSVAVTDAMQSVVMFAASITFWWIVYSAVGGWSGLETRLGEIDSDLAEKMLHVGGGGEESAPAALIVIGYMIMLTAYCIVNQSQAMRMLGSRSKWDVKMAAVLASAVTAVAMWFNVTLGILGRAQFPGLESHDKIFPQLVQQFLVVAESGLAGIVVAGLLAGALSTYDSIGSALSAVFTRDFYARFLVRNADDRHYLWVSRVVTVAAIAVSFGYIPFLKGGMVSFYMEITGVAVIPLLTVYLMGVLTPVNRRSGAIGLIGGIVYGLSRFLNPVLEWLSIGPLPIWWTNKWWGYIWSILITSAVMVACSMLFGWAKRKELVGLTCWHGDRPEADRSPGAGESVTWLETSKAAVPPMAEHPFSDTGPLPFYKRPLVWACLLIVVISYLNLVMFW
jgi:SSS family solute:Na+ symporter